MSVKKFSNTENHSGNEMKSSIRISLCSSLNHQEQKSKTLVILKYEKGKCSPFDETEKTWQTVWLYLKVPLQKEWLQTAK